MTEPDRLHYVIHGHELTGTRNPRTGRWRFECSTWPELAREHNGDTTPHAIMAVFASRAIPRLAIWEPADVL